MCSANRPLLSQMLAEFQVDNKNPNLAVLIDAENAEAKTIGHLLEEISKYGIATVRRVYADWRDEHTKSWTVEIMNEHSLQPRYQPSYTKGKNSSDIAMAIDAMDLLYTNRCDGFCLISSDSDFTPLASRIRESGLPVYGFGKEETTPKAFVATCNKFIFTEYLRKKPKQGTASKLIQDKELVSLLDGALETCSGDDGWAHLGPIGHNISVRKPEFDSRSYGYSKLRGLVKATGLFEEKLIPGGTGPQTLLIRKKTR